MATVRLTVKFKGSVQGVFFRRHIKKFAEKYNVCGYVKNLKDGSVEMVAVSDRDTLEKFMNEIQKKPGLGSIKTIDKKYSKNFEIFKDFQISY